MVLAVARQATDVVFIVFAASPRKRVLILRVALKTRTVSLRCRLLCRIASVGPAFGPTAIFGVLSAIRVANLARRCPRIF